MSSVSRSLSCRYMVANLSAQNRRYIKIGKDFMVNHGYIAYDFRRSAWNFQSKARRKRSKKNGSEEAGAHFLKKTGSRW